MIVTK